MSQSVFIGMIYNAALLMSLVLVYDIIYIRKRNEGIPTRVITGIVLGIMTIAVMINPWELTKGIIFDSRSILISITGLFFGTVPTIVTAIIATIYRIYSGGAGSLTGVCVIITSAIIGLVWRHLRLKKNEKISLKELYLFGLVVHVFMLAMMLTLPWNTAATALKTIALPVVLIYPVVTLLIGAAISQRMDHLRAIKILNESEERFRALFEYAPYGVAVSDKEGHLVLVNRALQKLLEYSQQEFNEMCIEEFTHPDDSQKEWGLFKELIGGSRNFYSMEKRYIRKDGAVVWGSVGVRAVRDIDGNLFQIILIVKDISERKQVEEALRQSQVRLVEAQKIARLGSYEYSYESGINYISSEALHLLGFEKESSFELISDFDDMLNNVHEEDRQLVMEQYENAYEYGHEIEVKFRYFHPDGTMKYFYAHGVVHRDVNGRPALLMGTIQDITDVTVAEQALRESEKMINIFFNSINDAVFIHPLQESGFGNFIEVNNVACERYGYTHEELLRMTAKDITKRTDAEKHGAPDFRRRLLEEGALIFETVHIKKNGEEVPVEISSNIIRQKNRKVILAVVRDITERKIMEAELRKRERLLSEMGKIAKIGGWEFNVETMEGTWTDEVARIHDMDPKNKTSVNLGISFYHGEYRKSIERAINVAVQQGKPYDLELEMTSAKGIRKWVRTIGTPFEENGRIVMLKGSFQDITDIKLRDKALLESEERFRAAFEGSASGMCIIDLDGKLQKVNNTLCEMLGYAKADLEGMDLDKLIHKDDLNIGADKLKKLISNEIQRAAFEKRYITSSGISVWTNNNMALLKNAEGRPLHFISQIEDITIRKEAEEALRKSEAQLSNAMEIARLGYWEYDVAGDLFTVDDHFYSILHTTAEEMGGYRISPEEYTEKFLHPEDRHVVAVEMKKAMETDDPNFSRRLEHRIIYSDGETGYMAVRYYVVKDSQGRTIKTYGANQDITQQKKAEREREKLENQLRQAQKMEAIGQLAGGVAHDFNNILQAIQGNCQFLLEGLDMESDEYEFAQEVYKGTRRAAALTRQLLAFSRRQVLEPKDIELNKLIVDLIKMIGRILGEHIELDFIPSYKSLTVHADSGQLEQVLLNLCVNARDAMPSGGKLMIETDFCVIDDEYCNNHPWAEKGNYALISVSDTGMGMDENTMRRIFEPFFTTKDVDKGTGLGLATVFGIIRQHSGLIHVYSEINKGTVFKIFLPLLEKEITESETSAPEVIHGGNEKILLAEDDGSVRNLTTRILREYGYDVITAEDGEEVMKLIRENYMNLDLLISDIIMPKGSGKDALVLFRELRPDARVILISGYSTGIIDGEYLTSHDIAFIQKPFNPQTLLKTIRNMLD